MNRARSTVDRLFRIQQQAADCFPLHLSPDGSHLVVTLHHISKVNMNGKDECYTSPGVSQRLISSHVLMIDTATGAIQEPFPGGTSWGARWSPDGTRLAAYVLHEGDYAHLAIWEKISGHILQFSQVRVHARKGYEVPQWTPDGHALVLKMTAASRLPYQSESYDLTRIDVTTGEIRLLAENWNIVGGWKIAPDGHAVALFRSIANDPLSRHVFCDLVSISLQKGISQVLAHRIPQITGLGLNWSPDSNWLAYTSLEGMSQEITHAHLFVVAADGSTNPQRLSEPDEALSLYRGDEREHEAPRWSEDGQRLYWLTQHGCRVFDTDLHRDIEIPPDREVIGWVQPPLSATLWTPLPETPLLLTRHLQTKDTGFALFSLGRRQCNLLVEEPVMILCPSFHIEVDVDKSTVYALVRQDNYSVSLWRFDYDSGHTQQLCSFNSPF